MAEEPNDALPLVRVAAFCEAVLHEKSELLTLVRLVDRVNIAVVPGATGAPTPEEMPEAHLALTFVLSTIAGPARGSRTLKLMMMRPDGSQAFGSDLSHVQTYERESHMQNWVVSLRIGVRSVGTAWLVVLCNEQVLTRVPLAIAYERNPKTSAG
jgi:hypothetical protein